MDILTFETCWAVNSEIIEQVTSSWSIFIQQKILLQSLNEIWLFERHLSDQMNCRPYLSDRVVVSCPRRQFAQSEARVNHTKLSYKRTSRRLTLVFSNAPPLSLRTCAVDSLQVSRPFLVPRSWPASVTQHHYVYAFLCCFPLKNIALFSPNSQTIIWQKYLISSRPPVNISDCKNNSYIFKTLKPTIFESKLLYHPCL